MPQSRHCSETAGRAIGAQAGWLIKKSVLELGGQRPFIVMHLRSRSRDRNCGAGALRQQWQSCIAAKRFIVADEIYDAFESRFVAGMEAVRVGDPMKKAPESAPRDGSQCRAA